MSRLFAAYDRALNRSPILTKTLTSVTLFMLGDVAAQKIEGRADLDLHRLARQGAWGVIFTPLCHAWYLNLDRWFPGKGAAVVAKKLAADQLTWTPVINTIFLSTVTLMATADAGKAVDAVREKLWPTLKVNWVVWPALSAINLSVVPLQYRILFINFCSLGWSAYLSNVANAKSSAVQHAPAGPTHATTPASSAPLS